MLKRVSVVASLTALAFAVMAVAQEEAQEETAKAPHVLAIKGDSAYTCDCAADCKCVLKEGDDAKCSCGKDVLKISVKGRFVCVKCRVIKLQGCAAEDPDCEKARCEKCGDLLKKVE